MKLCGDMNDGVIQEVIRNIFITYIVVLTCFILFLLRRLFKSLHMFPIKEKCGKLILLLVLFSYIHAISYPTLWIIDMKDYDEKLMSYISGGLQCLYNSYAVIYFIRCLRISYAYHVNLKLDGMYYQIIRRESICCILTIIMVLIIYLLPAVLSNFNDYLFYDDSQDQPDDLTIYNFEDSKTAAIFNSIALLISLFLIRARSTFKIEIEMFLAIVLEFAFQGIKDLYGFTFHHGHCEFYVPIYYIIDCCKLYMILLISVIIPLLQVRKVAEHFPYVIVADNFELFLSEPMCINLFYEYLVSYDQLNHSKYHKSISNDTILTPPVIKKLIASSNVAYDLSFVDPSIIKNQSLFDTNDIDPLVDHRIHAVTIAPEMIKSDVVKKLQTVQCLILWVDLTLIFAKFNALHQDQPVDNLSLLEDEIIQYMTNLLEIVDLNTFMPVKLAQQVYIQFGSLIKSQISSRKTGIHLSIWSIRAYTNSLRQIFSRHGSKTSFVDTIKILHEKDFTMQSGQIVQEDDQEQDVEQEEEKKEKIQEQLLSKEKNVRQQSKKKDYIDEQEEDSKENISVLELAYEIRYLMFGIISRLFEEDYKKSVSFDTLQGSFKMNELVQFRLYKMDLTAEFK